VSTPQGVVQRSSETVSYSQRPIEDYVAPAAEPEDLPFDPAEDLLPGEEDDSDLYQSIPVTAKTPIFASINLLTPPDSPKIPSFGHINTQIPASLSTDTAFRVPTVPALLPTPRLQAVPEKPSEAGPLSSAFFTGRGWNVTKKYPGAESKPMSFAAPQTMKTPQRKESKEIAPLETPSLYLKAKENAASLPWFRLDPLSTANSVPSAPVTSDAKLSLNQANSFTPTAPRYQVSFSLPKLRTPVPVFAPPPVQYSPPPQLDSLYGSALLPPTLFRDLQSLDSADKPPVRALSDVSNTLPQAEAKPRSLLASLDKLAYSGPQQLDDFESLFRDI